MVWVARPHLVDAAFDTWVFPFIGFLFLPFTTLMSVVLYRVGGLSGFDRVWIGLAVLVDIGHTFTGYSQRQQIPRRTPTMI